MAKSRRKNQAPRASQPARTRDGRYAMDPAHWDFDEDGLLIEPEIVKAPMPSAPNFTVASHISGAIKEKIQGLMTGLQGLESFLEKKDENPDYANFYEQNRQGAQNLLAMGQQLEGTYDKLAKLSSQRHDIHATLVKDNYLSQDELNQYLGVISPEPLQAYLEELRNRPATTTEGEAPRAPLSSEDLNDLSRPNHNYFTATRDRLVSAGKLNDAEVQRLNQLAPPAAATLQTAKEQVGAKILRHDIAKKTSHRQSLQQIDREEQEQVAELDEYIENYNRLVAGLIGQIGELTSKAETAHTRAAQLRRLSQQSGLSTLQPGQTLWISSKRGSKDSAHLTTEVSIQNITFGEAGHDPDRATEEQLIMPSFDPMIEFTITAADGQTETLKLSSSAFQKWALNNNLSEKFNNLAALETSLGLPPEALKAGTVLHYQMLREVESMKELGTVDEHQTTVESLSDGYVHLSAAVPIQTTYSGTNRLRYQQTKKLSLEQFAKWYRQVNATPQIETVQALDSLLAQHHEQLKSEMKWAENHGQPIQLSSATMPFFLISAYDPHTRDVLKITGLQKNPDGVPHILVDGGKAVPLNDFYRQVREHGLTIPNAEQLAEIKSRPDLMQNPEEQTKKLDEAAAAQPKPPAGPDTKAADPKAELSHPKKGYFGELWENTRVLNLMQIYQLFIKAPKEQIEKYFKEKMDRSTNFAGKAIHKGNPNLFGLQKLENKYIGDYNADVSKQVKEKEEFYDNNLAPDDVFKELYNAPTKIVLKAALQFLCKKGRIRWEDDKDLHKILNHHLNTHTYPKEYHDLVGAGRVIKAGDLEVSRKAPMLNSSKQCEMLLDEEFGPGTFDNLNRPNDGSYNTARKEATDKYHDYDKLQGKVPTILRKMIDDFSKDGDVSSATFDGLLSGALQKNEIGLSEGFMLYITSLTLKNSKGLTLLPFSKTLPYVGELSSYNAFLYFVLSHEVLDEKGNEVLDENGKPKRAAFTPNEYHRIYDTVIRKDIEAAGKTGPGRFIVGKNMNTWIRAQVLTNGKVKSKITEKINNANTDAGLYHYIGPCAQTDSNVEQLVRKGVEGGRESAGIIKNTYAGYNEQMIVAANRLGHGRNPDDNETRANEFANLINTFTYFNHILQRRMHLRQRDDAYMRLTPAISEAKLDIDDNKKRLVKDYIRENEDYTGSIMRELVVWCKDSDYRKLYQRIIVSKSDDITKEEELTFRNKTFEAIQRMHREEPARLARLARQYTGKLQGMSAGVLLEQELNVGLAPALYS